MINEILMFPEVNYSNLKELFSTLGQESFPLLLRVIRHAHIISQRETFSAGYGQTTDNQICGTEQTVSCSPSFILRQNNIRDNTSSQLRSEAKKCNVWYYIRS